MATASAPAARSTAPPPSRAALASPLVEPAGRFLRTLDHPLARHLRTAGELARAHRLAPGREGLPFGSPELARLLPGGLPRGELVEVVGERSSGRLSAVLALLAAVTGRGDGAALIDLGDGLDPRLAAGAGIDLPRLLWARCPTLREGLAAVEIALGGGWPLVVFELGERPIPGGRGAESCWQRLAHTLRERDSALLVASPCRVSGPAASLVLHGERGAARWLGRQGGPGTLAGACGSWRPAKGRGPWTNASEPPPRRAAEGCAEPPEPPPPAGGKGRIPGTDRACPPVRQGLSIARAS